VRILLALVLVAYAAAVVHGQGWFGALLLVGVALAAAGWVRWVERRQRVEQLWREADRLSGPRVQRRRRRP
jgi:hypothetical protein